MENDGPKVICPHCGEPNPKSLLVTTCQKCLGPLEAAPPASGEAVTAVPPAEEQTAPVAESSLEVGKREPGPSAASDEGSFDDLRPYVLALAILVGVVVAILAVVSGNWWLVAIEVAVVVVGVGAFVVVRAALVASNYELTVDPHPEGVPLGSSFTWGVVVKASKPIDLGPGRLVLRCREHTIGVVRRSVEYRHTIHEESHVFAGQHLEAGEASELRARLPIPASAAPSYQGYRSWIDWMLFVEAPVPGICPDIKQRVQLGVLPLIAAGGDRASEQEESMLADWLGAVVGEVEPGAVREGPLLAKLSAGDGDGSEALPAVSVGSSRRLILTLNAEEDIDCRAIRYRICCRIHGQGTPDEVDVAAPGDPVHEGALLAGQTIECPIAVAIPDEGPVSYRGRNVNFDWLVRVEVDMPGWEDLHLDVPLVVTPDLGHRRELLS